MPVLVPGLTAALSYVADIFVDGHEVDLKYQSPLAKNQAVRDAENIVSWIKSLSELGQEAVSIINKKAVALWLAKTFSVSYRILIS